MCGLVGVIGLIGIKERKVFRDLLIMDSIRGEHSTGIAVVSKDGDVKLAKAAGNPWNLFNGGDYDKVMSPISGIKALIGHNRFATVGAHTNENAHPFLVGDVVGAHNGTLLHIYKLKDNAQFEVDSQAIFHNINLDGWEETLARLNGAWALTFYDKRDEEMHFIRNDARPLFYCYSEDNKTLFWASIEWMLKGALARAGLKHHKIEQFDEFKHFHIDLSGDGDIEKRTLFYSKQEYKGFVPAYPNVSQYQGHFMGHNVWIGGGNNWFPPPKQDGVNRLKKLINKEVEFFVEGLQKDAQNIPYLYCRPTTFNETYHIRIYSTGDPRWDSWVNSKGNFTAKVKKIVTRPHEQYLLINYRTMSEEKPVDGLIVEVPQDTAPKKWVKYDVFKGYMGKQMPYADFIQVTKRGCSYCGQDAEDTFPPDSLVFIGAEQFLCPDCAAAQQSRIFA